MDHRLGVGEVGLEARRISSGSKGNCPVRGISAIVSADSVLVHEVCGGSNDGAAIFGVGSSPYTWNGVHVELTWVAREYDGLN